MPNGHGILFGCFLCTHYVRGGENPLIGSCSKHRINTDMHSFCTDMKYYEPELPESERQKIVEKHMEDFKKGILYLYWDISGYGYPPPLEIVPFAPIEVCKNMTEETRQELMKKANTTALEQYQKRLNE